MYNKLTVEDVDVKGKKVLVRCDFNVPLDADGNITDENRIVGALPTIKYLIDNGARVILCSHMGKPKGEPVPSLSLAPVAKSLSEKLGKEVVFAADDNVVGDNAKKAVAEMNDGDVVLLQNTRYRKEETKNEEAFSKELASLADLFVNDAFGTAHRAHCSNVGVSSILKPAVAGYLIEKEINFLGNAVNNPVRPLVAILGGSKVSSKISVIENLLKKVDKLIIGGGMAYTFFAAQGKTTGTSLLEPDYIDYAKKMLDEAGYSDCKICASNALDEYLIRDMIYQGAKVDMFGVGERLITAKSEPVFGGVYKLAAVEDDDGNIQPKIKISENVAKITTPHFKKLYRIYDKNNHKAVADLLCVHDEVIDESRPLTLFDPQFTWKKKVVTNFEAKPIQQQIFKDGKCVYKKPAYEDIVKYAAAEIDTLWDEITRFENPHTYYVDLSQKLWNVKNYLLAENSRQTAD